MGRRDSQANPGLGHPDGLEHSAAISVVVMEGPDKLVFRFVLNRTPLLLTTGTTRIVKLKIMKMAK